MQQQENWALDNKVKFHPWIHLAQRVCGQFVPQSEQTGMEIVPFSRCRVWLTITLHSFVSVKVTQEFALWSMTFVLQSHFTGSGLHHIIPHYMLFSYFSVHEISKQLSFSLSTLRTRPCGHAFKFNCFWLDSVRDGAITELFSCPSLVWLVSV